MSKAITTHVDSSHRGVWLVVVKIRPNLGKIHLTRLRLAERLFLHKLTILAFICHAHESNRPCSHLFAFVGIRLKYRLSPPSRPFDRDAHWKCISPYPQSRPTAEELGLEASTKVIGDQWTGTSTLVDMQKGNSFRFIAMAKTSQSNHHEL
ncbi:hypothetical protein EJ08DRAFT_107928 [Tothia fuscella]|uniref:Uncharacterized protein n=1 Tax=Tothia fuscella TaxID=1048955 RepID=A0A9P4NDX1_9PEZI|nr:hypothetical protein EJ08DRAFT_107928 [Tothia fuscella]